MREGLDGDDIYVMVEDEFLAVAQSFTRHLHHAEYIRRTKQAQIDNATKINDLARPTDKKTAMRAETRKKKDAESMLERHKLALEKMKGSRPPVDSEEEDTRIEEDEEDDPWLGTSLQGLMTKTIRSQSLVGLQGIQSTTRAAAGFSKSSGSNIRSSPPVKQEPHVIDDDGVTASGEEDDLDTGLSREPVRKNFTTPRRRDPPLPNRHISSRESSNGNSQKISTPKTPMEPPGKRSAFKSSRDRNSTPKATYIPRKSLTFDEFDDSDLFRRDKAAPRRSSSYSSTITPKKEDEQDKEKKKKSRLNEVPIFLT